MCLNVAQFSQSTWAKGDGWRDLVKICACFKGVKFCLAQLSAQIFSVFSKYFVMKKLVYTTHLPASQIAPILFLKRDLVLFMFMCVYYTSAVAFRGQKTESDSLEQTPP